VNYFLVIKCPFIGDRAATHIIWAVVVALAMKEGFSFPKALFLIGLPLHGLLERARSELTCVSKERLI
jgi:hypothetical protein